MTNQHKMARPSIGPITNRIAACIVATSIICASLTNVMAASAKDPASDLSTAQARSFAACLPQFNEAGEKLEKSGALKIINDEMDGLRIKEGKLRIYSAPMARLKDVMPSVYSEFNDLAKACGMGSVSNFADIGDRVMAAYLARQMPPGTAEQLKALTPEMMAMMPPAAKQGFEMVRALENVSEADKNALDKEIIKALDKMTGNAGKKGKVPSILGQQ